MRRTSSKYALALASVFVSVISSSPAHATPGECERSIIAEFRPYANNVMRNLQKCEDKIVHGTLPPGTDCPTQPDIVTKIAGAQGLFRHHVNSACGGNNHACNAADTGQNADETLASIGWDIGVCPDFEGGGCNNPITDCNDIADCLFCLVGAAQIQATALDYGAMNVPTSDRKLESCQREMGKRAVAFFSKKLQRMEKCERKVLSGDLPGPCPDPDTQQHIATLELKTHAKICGKCGGANKLCGGGDDRTPAEIGFVSSCPGVTIPGGASCAGAIATLDDITTCADCVSEFKVDCLDASLVPALKSYPAECNVAP